MKPTNVQVRALEGVKVDFLRRHRKDSARAETAWAGLLAKAARLAADPTLGDAIPRDRWPKTMRQLPNLFRLELPGGFRALYTIIYVQGEGHIARIDWIGDHKEYDRLFGYSTS